MQSVVLWHWCVTTRSLYGTTISASWLIESGRIYKSGAVIGAGDDLPPAKRPDEWNGQAGTRAPHISMRRGEDTISSLDLFCQGWVLISKDESWKAVLKDAGEATGVECSFVQVGNEVDEVKRGEFGESFGVDDTGAVLVRPDGYIAWKMASESEDRSASLKEALGKTSYSVKHSA
ncbi:hypothetical protein NM208_g16059 [Fusarium decemcellulare]|uniref:Uncharacterized protein n=1 Tax=Fusarium decemcellulare TaxID=57161 RepID=A0ACC1RB98_9HYPO|nr:hypothetical protein NM208_g16059 [Fusarium decemcellulare]